VAVVLFKTVESESVAVSPARKEASVETDIFTGLRVKSKFFFELWTTALNVVDIN
jgi:hypothetical protein